MSEDRYAPYNPSFLVMAQARERVAAGLLQRAGVFPGPGTRCLEVGFGRLGCLAMLLGWGVRIADLHGMELDAERAAVARSALPGADLRVGDATAMPWPDASFDLVICSTVFSSILAPGVRHLLAREIVRVLAPGGALLWYDMAVNSPRNAGVRGASRRQIRELFPDLRGPIRSATLAPPLARLVAPRSWSLATALDAIGLLRSHLVAVLVKTPEAAPTAGHARDAAQAQGHGRSGSHWAGLQRRWTYLSLRRR